MYDKLYRFYLDRYTEYIAEYQFSNTELRIVLEDLVDEVRYEGYFIKENDKWIFDKNNKCNTLHNNAIKAIEDYLNMNGDPK